jgi:hypothetical protein
VPTAAEDFWFKVGNGSTVEMGIECIFKNKHRR